MLGLGDEVGEVIASGFDILRTVNFLIFFGNAMKVLLSVVPGSDPSIGFCSGGRCTGTATDSCVVVGTTSTEACDNSS